MPTLEMTAADRAIYGSGYTGTQRWLRANKMCVRCGRPSKSYKCNTCAVVDSVRLRAHYRKVKAAGRCTKCSKRREQPKRSLCNEHLEEARRRQNIRNRSGMRAR